MLIRFSSLIYNMCNSILEATGMKGKSGLLLDLLAARNLKKNTFNLV